MKEKESYEMFRFEEKYKEEVVNLVSNEWDRFDEDYFNWKFFENPYSDIVGYVILFNKKVVGFRGLMGSNFMINKESLLFTSLADGVIDKNHRRKGLFTKVNNYLLHDLSNNSDVRLVYTMSSILASSKSYLKQGWKVLCLRRTLVYKNFSGLTMGMGMKYKFVRKVANLFSSFQDLLFTKKIKGRIGYKVLISSKAHPDLFSEVNSITKNNKIEQQKDAKFYQWRLANPEKHVHYNFAYLFNRKEEVIAYLIFSISGRSSYLIDYNYKNDINDFSFLLNYTIRKKKVGFFSTWGFGMDDKTLKALKHAGFFEPNLFFKLFPRRASRYSLPVIVNITDSGKGWQVNGTDISKIDNWSIKMIDSDGV